jgi:hypothetical protein
MCIGGESFHPSPKTMLDLTTIQYASTIYRDNDAGKARAEETLAVAIETACPGETFDLFHNGRGWVVRMFEDGEFVQTI